MVILSPFEKGLLSIWILVSLSLFLRRFLPVLDRIRRAKPEPGYTLGDLARRAAVFLWEVILQGKVIQQRPVPGLAHAFVF